MLPSFTLRLAAVDLQDNQIVNLPYALLVKGDRMVLRPGHITPGPCYKVGGKRKFKVNETYGVPPQLTDPYEASGSKSSTQFSVLSGNHAIPRQLENHLMAKISL